jgi:hypothetical protein
MITGGGRRLFAKLPRGSGVRLITLLGRFVCQSLGESTPSTIPFGEYSIRRYSAPIFRNSCSIVYGVPKISEQEILILMGNLPVSIELIVAWSYGALIFNVRRCDPSSPGIKASFLYSYRSFKIFGIKDSIVRLIAGAVGEKFFNRKLRFAISSPFREIEKPINFGQGI